MARCTRCTTELEPDCRFCTNCGLQVASAPPPPDSRKLRAEQLPLLPLPLVIGQRYRLFESCGGGGMAQVYRAEDQRMPGREVAIKVINPALRTDQEFDERFRREASILGTLSDPHIVVAHDFDIDPTYGPYLVMEYLRGQSLRERLRRDGKLPFNVVMQIGAQVLLALQHAHDRGIVHRDIKPDNLFLVQQPGSLLLVRVLDFGIARIYRDDKELPTPNKKLTLPGAVIGTPKYMAPEQLASEPIDARADLYSLAVVLFEAMTGVVPKQPNPPRLRNLCPDAPPSLDALMAECLNLDPKRRPANAMIVFERLQHLSDEHGNVLFHSGPTSAVNLPIFRSDDRSETSIRTTMLQRVGRRGWLAVGATTIALAGFWVGYQMFARTGPNPTPERESILGVEIGMDRAAVVDRLGRPDDEWAGDPWSTPAKPHLGHLLEPGDLGSRASMGTILHWSAKQVCIVLVDDRVQALVAGADSQAQSGRGVRIGDRDLRLEQHYPEAPNMNNFSDPPISKSTPPGWGMTYRYDSHGIGFELRAHRVSSITLFPPRQP